jgi:hypothetical protein
MVRSRLHWSLLSILLALAPAVALAAPDNSRLGKDLTPIGAERAGNADGTIPAWEGGLTKPPPGWTREKGYIDPFPDDKPLFTITGANVEQYKSKLTTGEIALLKKYPEFRMNVYPTRRTAALPKEVTDRVAARAGKVTLQGFGLKDLGGSTTPFPIPQNGLEAIWNHLVRYLGGGAIRSAVAIPVASRRSMAPASSSSSTGPGSRPDAWPEALGRRRNQGCQPIDAGIGSSACSSSRVVNRPSRTRPA